MGNKESGRNKTFPACDRDDSLRDANTKLRAKTRRLESDKRQLISEIKQYRDVFESTKDFLRNSTDSFSLKEILNKVKKHKPLHSINEEELEDIVICPDCTRKIDILSFKQFDLYLCECGYKKRVSK